MRKRGLVVVGTVVGLFLGIDDCSSTVALLLYDTLGPATSKAVELCGSLEFPVKSLSSVRVVTSRAGFRGWSHNLVVVLGTARGVAVDRVVIVINKVPFVAVSAVLNRIQPAMASMKRGAHRRLAGPTTPASIFQKLAALITLVRGVWMELAGLEASKQPTGFSTATNCFSK